jgi:hypothetical protein
MRRSEANGYGPRPEQVADISSSREKKAVTFPALMNAVTMLAQCSLRQAHLTLNPHSYLDSSFLAHRVGMFIQNT